MMSKEARGEETLQQERKITLPAMMRSRVEMHVIAFDRFTRSDSQRRSATDAEQVR